jgi:hypothetical protein
MTLAIATLMARDLTAQQFQPARRRGVPVEAPEPRRAPVRRALRTLTRRAEPALSRA